MIESEGMCTVSVSMLTKCIHGGMNLCIHILCLCTMEPGLISKDFLKYPRIQRTISRINIGMCIVETGHNILQT